MYTIKTIYTKRIKNWLENFLLKNYSEEYYIEVLIPNCNISKINNADLKRVPNCYLMDFYPDILGILKSKKNNDVELVLLNRSIGTTSIKEIGEMNIYSNIVNPKMAFIVSLKGLPNEVNSLLLNENICDSLLSYNKKKMLILKVDLDHIVDEKCIFPREFKNHF